MGSRFRLAPDDGWPLSDDRVKQVKAANDIVDVVGTYLTLRPAGGTFKGLCPFHDDHRPSFDVDPRRQRFRCWSCGKHGDVLSFVQEFERVSFVEALQLLARRAGIDLEDTPQATANARNRAALLDVMRWASRQFHDCLFESPLAERARTYLAERGLLAETSRAWGLGYAPVDGQWLVRRAEQAGVSSELLETVGLIAARTEQAGYYDRFRDRILFPIRDVRGQVVGFGGRILPDSPLASRVPKYYNSCDTPLFCKSEQLYGIDVARQAGEKAGYLAVVEGYTDVLMAHQLGICQVVATMGTALNDRHVKQLRRFVPRVVLVFDADAGGDQGVDRALELFVSHELELAVATLPLNLDPCDLLLEQGAEAFRRVLSGAVDALEFKLTSLLARQDTNTVEGRRQVVDAVLRVISRAPALPGQTGAVKMELMIERIAQRLAMQPRTVWARWVEMRHEQQKTASSLRIRPSVEEPARSAPAAPQERRLLELLLAEPTLVAQAMSRCSVEDISHPGVRRLVASLFALSQQGLPPTLDQLRLTLDSPALLSKAFELQEAGLARSDRGRELEDLLTWFRLRREKSVKEQLHGQLRAADNERSALELLRRLQNQTVESAPVSASGEEEAAVLLPPHTSSGSQVAS